MSSDDKSRQDGDGGESGGSKSGGGAPAHKDHQGGVGIDGHAAHGGDVAPPNSDQAGRRQSPESGPIDKH